MFNKAHRTPWIYLHRNTTNVLRQNNRNVLLIGIMICKTEYTERDESCSRFLPCTNWIYYCLVFCCLMILKQTLSKLVSLQEAMFYENKFIFRISGNNLPEMWNDFSTRSNETISCTNISILIKEYCVDTHTHTSHICDNI